MSFVLVLGSPDGEYLSENQNYVSMAPGYRSYVSHWAVMGYNLLLLEEDAELTRMIPW